MLFTDTGDEGGFCPVKRQQVVKLQHILYFLLPSIDPFLQDKKITVRFSGQTNFFTGSFQVSVKV